MMNIRLFFMMATVLFFAGTNAVTGSFTDNGDGTVTDNRFGLIWQQDGSQNMTWEDASSYCTDLELPADACDTEGWRLPNIKELAFLTDENLHSPAIDPIFETDSLHYWYWSDTTVVFGVTDSIWGVNFSNGDINGQDISESGSVRCVCSP